MIMIIIMTSTPPPARPGLSPLGPHPDVLDHSIAQCPAPPVIALGFLQCAKWASVGSMPPGLLGCRRDGEAVACCPTVPRAQAKSRGQRRPIPSPYPPLGPSAAPVCHGHHRGQGVGLLRFASADELRRRVRELAELHLRELEATLETIGQTAEGLPVPTC